MTNIISNIILGDYMRIKDELFGKEVLDADIQIVDRISDVVMDKDTFEITDLIIKKTGFSAT